MIKKTAIPNATPIAIPMGVAKNRTHTNTDRPLGFEIKAILIGFNGCLRDMYFRKSI